ncbi:MAG: hypothetical protein ACOYNQ_05255 [Burkholderiales bacterium]
MINIEALTQGYDATEDRIHIDVRDKAGASLRLWLTRRLSDVVIRGLCDSLERSRGRGDSNFDQFLQTVDQRAAQAGRKGGEPVRWQGEAVLLISVDLTRVENGRRLTFKTRLAGQQQGVATVALDEQRLRQWLSIVYRLYRTAGWPEDAWPDWLKTASKTMPMDT